MLTYNKSTGNTGEILACTYLAKIGFKIIDTNVYSRWGELDIVAQKGNKIHFVEVKTRISTRQGLPYEAVRITKLFHLMRSIQHYIKTRKLDNYRFQLDVIAVMLNHDQSLNGFKHYENVEVDRFF